MGDQFTERTMADLQTPKQAAAIFSICRAKGINADAEARKLYGCAADELSKRTASDFIDFLKAQADRRWGVAA